MKILQHANKNPINVVTFKCKNCGCEFEANEEEYFVDHGVALTTFPVKYSAYANCPECYRMAHSYTTSLSDILSNTTCCSGSINT